MPRKQRTCRHDRCEEVYVGSLTECHKCRNSRQRYGLNCPQRGDMLQEQGNKCKLCDRDIAFEGKVKSVQTAVIDHCHNHGHVRGIICHPCNAMIGYVENNLTLEQLQAYLYNNTITK